jgi:hypothetical protein
MGAQPQHELGATVGTWNALVRRARMTDKQKLSALLISSYANPDGTGIRCGVARLAADLGASYATGRRYLAWLRNVGLIELVQAGNRRRQTADVYRLIIGPDVLEHLEVLDPEAHKALGEGLREANREASQQRAKRAAAAHQRSPMQSAETTDQRSPEAGVDETPTGPESTLNHLGAENPDQRSNDPRSTLTLDEPPPPLRTSPVNTSLAKTSAADVRTNLAVARAPEPKPQDPEFGVVLEIRPGASQEARYRPRPRWAAATDAIAEASARRRAAEAAHRAEQEAT